MLIPVPPLAAYLILAVMLSGVLAVIGEYRDDIHVRNDANQLAAALQDFSTSCLSRMRTARPAGKEKEEEWRQRTEYIERFGAAITRIHSHFVIRRLSYKGLDKSYLGRGQSADLETFNLATLTSKLMTNFGSTSLLPSPERWFGYSLFRRFGLYVLAATAIWLILYGLHRS